MYEAMSATYEVLFSSPLSMFLMMSVISFPIVPIPSHAKRNMRAGFVSISSPQYMCLFPFGMDLFSPKLRHKLYLGICILYVSQ